MNLVQNKETFLNLVKTYIKRDGVEKCIAWLERSDLFVCPASTQYNLAVEGGLCQHALNVADLMIRKYFDKRVDELEEEDAGREFEGGITIETILLVSLFSSICKVNCYAKDFKNVKVNGKWEQQEYWKWSEQFIYSGRGSKSVYILQQYMKLYIEEAQAICFYMAGEDNVLSNVNDTTYKKIYEESQLALNLHLAEMEATYYLDKVVLDT